MDDGILWIIDSMMDERSLPTGRLLLADAASAAGHDVLRVRYRRDDPSWMDAVPLSGDRPVVCVGPHQGVDALVVAKGASWTPGAFHDVDRMTYAEIARHYGGTMLNSDHRFSTWREFAARLASDHPDGVFVRPDAVTKAFAGMVLKPDDLVSDTKTARKLADLDPDTRVAWAPLKRILGESRFVVADGAVVAGSTYRWGGKLDVRSDVPEIARTFAGLVAEADWQPDAVYVCDVAVVDAGGAYEARLVEMNPFSTSGLYACDTKAIVELVSAVALRMHCGPDPAADPGP